MNRRALWFKIRGPKPGSDSAQPYYHCPVCHEDQKDIDAGTYVQVGNLAHALICETCVPIARQRIDALFPGALVEVDDKDFRLSPEANAAGNAPTEPPPPATKKESKHG